MLDTVPGAGDSVLHKTDTKSSGAYILVEGDN